MNPIPLVAPDGVVYAHACAACGTVGSMGRFSGVPTAEERKRNVAFMARESLGRAERCCTCCECGAPLAHVEPDADGMVPLWTGTMCGPCDLAEERRRWWRRWCWAWEEVTRVAMQGLTYEQWKALQPTEPDDDE